jgi:hypothetical protein
LITFCNNLLFHFCSKYCSRHYFPYWLKAHWLFCVPPFLTYTKPASKFSQQSVFRPFVKRYNTLCGNRVHQPVFDQVSVAKAHIGFSWDSVLEFCTQNFCQNRFITPTCFPWRNSL